MSAPDAIFRSKSLTQDDFQRVIDEAHAVMGHSLIRIEETDAVIAEAARHTFSNYSLEMIKSDLAQMRYLAIGTLVVASTSAFTFFYLWQQARCR